MKKPENLILVIFGASGDLTKRKLIPEVYELHRQNLLPEKFAVLGVSRTKMTDNEFQDKLAGSIKTFGEVTDESDLNEFKRKLFYLSIDVASPGDYSKVKSRLLELGSDSGPEKNYIFYLSTPPSLYDTIPHFLAGQGLNSQKEGWKRLVIEKPFGYDYQSAHQLNNSLLTEWQEDQIYRIDHYLGKETVQNLLVTRFSNGIFEPLWNRNYVHHVEITNAENLGIESRGGYYEGTGALRDMVQNHLLQLLALVAMEPPSSFDSNAVRNEKLKVFQSLRPLSETDIYTNIIRGQYMASKIRGEIVTGYRDESGVDPGSRTETYIAMKLYVDNWRWGGVPFYIRTGKRLPTRVSEIVIHFKPTPHYLFMTKDGGDGHNQLVIRIQPDEGILLKFGMKVPGHGFDVQTVNMDFHYSDVSDIKLPDAYARLLLDCMLGDSTLYSRGDAVEAAWKFIDPILDLWKRSTNIPIYGYPAGTWGPDVADSLIEGKGFTWRYPCKNLVDDGIYCEL